MSTHRSIRAAGHSSFHEGEPVPVVPTRHPMHSVDLSTLHNNPTLTTVNVGSSTETLTRRGPSAPPAEKDRERTITGIRWVLVCAAVYSANMLYGLDTTIVADIQGAISGTFGDVARLGWLGVGFTLGSTVLILPLGKVFGVFDMKWVFVWCLAMFAAASGLCGAAPSMTAMIVGRVWAGAGGAGMYLGTLNLTTALCSTREQPFYVGMTGFVYGSGCILGPIVGGAFADSSATWRWSFYLNLVIFAIASPIYLFLLPSIPTRPGVPFTQKVKSLDWLGIALTAVLYVSFTIAFTFGGVIWDWSYAGTSACIVIFGAATIGFAVSQGLNILTSPIDRLFPCEFLRDPQLVLLYVLMACGGASLFVSVYYIPLYFLFVYGDTGVEAAVRLLPYVAFYVATILFCGAAMARVGYHWAWFLFSGLCLTAGASVMYTIQAHSPLSLIIGASVILGLGMMTSQAGYAVGNLLVVPPRRSELIQFLNISQGQSQLIGLVIASAIFQTRTFAGLQELLGDDFSEGEIRAALSGVRSEVLQNAPEEVREECIEVIVKSIGEAWILVIAAGAMYTLCSLFLTKTRYITAKEENAGIELSRVEA